jgi:hypothetical protein
VRFKLAILNVLAKCPGGRATLDEVRHEVGVMIESEAQTEQLKRFSALGDIDIFRSGLVLQDDDGLQITDAGLSLLHSLESSSGAFIAVPASQLTEERSRIFDLESRALDSNAHDGNEDDHQYPAHGEENPTVAIEAPNTTSQIGAVDMPKSTYSKGRERGRKSLKLGRLLAFIAEKKQSILGIGRRHFARKTSVAWKERNERLIRSVGGAAFALLSLALVVACVVAAIAFGQIQSLKSDVAALRREVLPVKERITRLEQIEKAKRDLDQQEEAQNKSDAEKNKPGGEIRTDQAALNLSREEIQLIKDYIKLAPSAGSTAPAINVGDPIGGATIPLPSPITEKVPKLIGARFTTRNGAIIISTKNSRRADAVLAPN